MKQTYCIGIDQSTQGTKAMLFDSRGDLLLRTDKCHAQLIDEKGWVEHDPEEIYQNTLKAVKDLLEQSRIDRGKIACVGISSQR
ncbi:FGGY family carbohydrate kinase, partial [Blautia pseudococcoides]|nr:FGGY family carbohydrate kinase [Blautia pseudococcoides]